MKLPFVFGIRLVFRIFLPGFFFSLFLFPLAFLIKKTLSQPVSAEIYFILAPALLGWLISLLDIPIYKLYEGREFWPPSIKRCGIKLQKRRLIALRKTAKTDVEKQIKLARFPLSEEFRTREAQAPTKLGNILAEAEQYPDIKYGMDGVFFWYRIWYLLDNDTRVWCDEIRSVADSALYISFVFIIGSIILLLYFLYELLFNGIIYSPIECYIYIILSIISLVLAYGLYRIATTLHEENSDYFKALFDVYWKKFDTGPIIAILENNILQKSLRGLSDSEKLFVAWQYLRWDQYSDVNTSKTKTVAEIFLEQKPPPAEK
ncbi:hypothetical protein V6C03_14365 [Methyloligella sp. 2.7D]|uniref:hypothetical protein n=1 Tax=unclassified Methyloligella TaxID=2625955 RepID=UPI00157DA8F6|nr:hypothetical protein [Methyloligella sp. GL2]QKP77062.1 hypothetical protein HT051_06100 [Methyloligella sp. GL2]